jgi:hypothetical protein
MQALRKIILAKQNMVSIELPDSLINHEVEVIILPIQKTGKSRIHSDKVSKYRGALKPDMDMAEIDKEIRKMRSEWERSI